MKKKLALLLVMVLLFIAFIGVKFFLLDKQTTDGILKVLSSPAASIFLNSNAIGKTPYEDKVKEGEYIVKLIPEGNATETASWQGKIKITRNSLSFIDRELGQSDLTSAGVIFTVAKMTTNASSPDQGEISVETEPDGGIVSLDNDEKGIAPLIISNIHKGDHEISVNSPGFFRRSQKVNVEAGFRINAQFKLAQDPAYKKVDEVSLTTTPQPTDKLTPSGKVTPTPTGTVTPVPTTSAGSKTGGFSVIVTDTPTGWLRVRVEPSTNASESAKVNPGDTFKVLEEKEGWYRINYKDSQSGWISAQYTKKT